MIHYWVCAWNQPMRTTSQLLQHDWSWQSLIALFPCLVLDVEIRDCPDRNAEHSLPARRAECTRYFSKLMAPWGRVSLLPRIITGKGAHQTLNWTILCVQEINLHFLSHWDLRIILASSIIYPDKHMNRIRSFLIWSAWSASTASILSMNKLYAQLHKILCMDVCMCVCSFVHDILNPFLLSGSDSKESVCNAGGPGSIPGSGRSPGEGNGNPLQYSCLENHFNRGAWWATVYGVAKIQARLSD